MRYTIYTRGSCTFCDTAKRYLREHNVVYKEVYLTSDEDVKQVKSFIPEHLKQQPIRLPIVFKNKEYLGDHEAMIRDHQAFLNNTWSADQIFNLLHDNVCSVEYKKVNGELVRLRRCTLMEDMLPKGVQPAMTNSSFFTVYDLDTEAWGGFSVASIKSITVTGE